MAQDIRHEPIDIPDLVGYWDQRADDYEQDRLRCIADHNYTGAAYYMGRVDMARSAAGELRGMLAPKWTAGDSGPGGDSYYGPTVDGEDDDVRYLRSVAPRGGESVDPRDEEAAAIERLDGHKFRGDTSVLMAGR